MNSLLDITGHFLYLALRIILLPLFIMLDCFLGLWLVAKFSRKFFHKTYYSSKQKHVQHQLALKKRMVLLRTKFVGFNVNGH